jgi:hypothetical protein
MNLIVKQKEAHAKNLPTAPQKCMDRFFPLPYIEFPCGITTY